MTKALRKEIMERSRFKNVYWRTRNGKNTKTARNKEIFSHKFTQKTQSEYFRNINIKKLNDNKTFWKKIIFR